MSLTLITGAPGWLGTRFVQWLVEREAAGAPVPEAPRRIRCLVKPGVDPAPLRELSNQIEIVVGDLRSPAAIKEFFHAAADATLFHCAGIVHPSFFVHEIFQVNVNGTRVLLAGAQAAGVRRAVVISSNSPAGVSYDANHLFDEESPNRPYMSYGRSKMLMEQAVHNVQAQGKLQTVIVRPTWFYGEGQPQRQDTFFRMIRKGSAPIVGTGNSRRSMTYIDNLCQALLLCESSPIADGQTYWIADRRPYTMNQIVDTVEMLMEREFGLTVAHRRMRMPFVAGEMAMWADRVIQGVGLYQQKVHVLSEMNKTIACSVAKAERELGYHPTVELEEGMRRSIAWCLAHDRSI